jgi:hypothetical protein
MSNGVHIPQEAEVEQILSVLPHVVIAGSFPTGFFYVGPFDGFAAAEAYVEEQRLEDDHPTVCITVLEEPVREDTAPNQ